VRVENDAKGVLWPRLNGCRSGYANGFTRRSARNRHGDRLDGRIYHGRNGAAARVARQYDYRGAKCGCGNNEVDIEVFDAGPGDCEPRRVQNSAEETDLTAVAYSNGLTATSGRNQRTIAQAMRQVIRGHRGVAGKSMGFWRNGWATLWIPGERLVMVHRRRALH